ncbi:hypothetical protein [Streptomyces sp. NPDC002205]|uniref:hypothetical protein n=1 Tax=Streptomyces sp. NPDC002205 TaxID=3154411 RepID=UPI00332CB06C
MNDSTPSEPNPEDGEPTSFAKNAKSLIKKHKGKIIIGCTVLGVAAGVIVISLAKGLAATKGTEHLELFPDPVAGGQKLHTGMEKCVECTTEFDVEDARDEYNSHFDGGLNYDEDCGGEPGEKLCADCGISQSESNMKLGNALLGMMMGVEDDNV